MCDFFLILIAVFGGAFISYVATGVLDARAQDAIERAHQKRINQYFARIMALNSEARHRNQLIHNLHARLDSAEVVMQKAKVEVDDLRARLAVNKVQSLQTHPTLYVLAPSAEAGIHWARLNFSGAGINRTTIVTKPQQLRGITEGQYAVVPGFWLNEQWQAQISLCNRQSTFLRYVP